MDGAVPLRGLDLRLDDRAWGFAEEQRLKIARHWRALIAEKPFLWNGDVLICTAHRIEDGRLSARFCRTDYASFVAWRDWGWPDREACNCFGVPAVVSSDGILLMGTMGPHTLNHGMAYPPSGSLEGRDIGPERRIDIEGSMAKELREETGLDLGLATPGRMIAVSDGRRLAVARRFDMPMVFGDMENVFRAHAAAGGEQELSDVFGIRSADHAGGNVPAYARTIIGALLLGGA